MAPKLPVQIIVVKLGWVLVGNPEAKPEHLVLNNASVVRRWGTTKGLGELAFDGPQKSTVLDKCGHVQLQWDAVLFRIDCESSKWKL
jgi:hypothetical protein